MKIKTGFSRKLMGQTQILYVSFQVQAVFQFEGKLAKYFAPDRSVSPIMVVKREVYFGIWRRGGSVVERRTRDLEAPSSNPTTAV